MKKLLVLFALTLTFFTFSTSQANAVTWERVNEDGFGDTTDQDDFFDFTIFNDCLYAGIESGSTTEGARVHRTCDGTTWTQVNEDGFGDPPENDHVDSMKEFNGYLYVSTAVSNSTFDGFKLWRSTTGNLGTWEEVIPDGAGDNRNENLKALNIFDGWLCGGTWNNTLGAAIWCSQNGTDWVQKSLDGFGDSSNTIIWHTTTFNDYFYAGTQNSSGGEIWRTNDLTSWEQIEDDGFGYTTNQARIRGLQVFNNALYTVAKNGAGNLAEVKKSTDGESFSTVSTLTNLNNLGPATAQPTMHVFDGYLHIASSNSTDGFEVFRSTDALTWESIASGGLDSSTQTYALLYGYKGYLYLGTKNTSVGQKVWRTYYFDYTYVAPSNDSSNNSSDDSPNRPSCTGAPPPLAPDLFQIKTTNTTATLYFTPINGIDAHYWIVFGETDDPNAIYGARLDFGESSGAIPFDITSLKPNKSYFFKVMAANICGAGPWSNLLQAKTGKSILFKLFHAH